MANKKDFPKELHRFIDAINLFKHRWTDQDIFCDMVDLFVAGLSWHGDPVLAQQRKDKYGEFFGKFQDLFKAYIFTLRDNLVADNGNIGWNDPIGDLFMNIALRSKKEFREQSFAPPHICKVWGLISHGVLKEQKQVIAAFDCGPGRMLLTANEINPGNYVIGQDNVELYVKMAAINMAHHGVQGQVRHMDTPDSGYHSGYLINPFMSKIKIPYPHILPVDHQQALLTQALYINERDHPRTFSMSPKQLTNESIKRLKTKPVYPRRRSIPEIVLLQREKRRFVEKAKQVAEIHRTAVLENETQKVSGVLPANGRRKYRGKSMPV